VGDRPFESQAGIWVDRYVQTDLKFHKAEEKSHWALKEGTMKRANNEQLGLGTATVLSTVITG
jgi:hypothetical protein